MIMIHFIHTASVPRNPIVRRSGHAGHWTARLRREPSRRWRRNAHSAVVVHDSVDHQLCAVPGGFGTVDAPQASLEEGGTLVDETHCCGYRDVRSEQLKLGSRYYQKLTSSPLSLHSTSTASLDSSATERPLKQLQHIQSPNKLI
jgi:hypothetical protein